MISTHDPCAWLQGKTYYAAVNKRKPEGDGDAAFLYKSQDLRHMLLFCNHVQGTQYYIGHLENETFYPALHGRNLALPAGAGSGGG